MQDQFHREIDYLRLSVTELCNLRCKYCMPEEGICKKDHAEMLTEDEMIQAVEVAAALGVKKVRITGGEPLVKKNILSICRRAARVEGIEELCLTTNGILLPQMALPLKEAGVKRINLSIDTLNAEKYASITRLGKLSDALAGLEAALAAGFEKVKVNAVLIGGFNDDEIPALAELTRKYPIDVRFIELMPMGGEKGFGAEAFVPCDRVLQLLPELQKRNYSSRDARLYAFPDALGNVGLISPLSDHFCALCNRIRLTADGKLKPCLHSSQEISIKGLDAAGVKEKMEEAILAKPACHGELSEICRSQAGRDMHQIGG